MEQTQEKIVDSNSGLDFKRIDLKHEEYLNKPRYFVVKNWRTIEKEINGKPAFEWKADVVKYGESVSVINVVLNNSKELAEGAKSFRALVNKLLENKNSQVEVLLRVKYSGKENGRHKFDVEIA